MSELWDDVTDFLVAGTGAAALSAAIKAAGSGAAVIVTESTGKWGGTTFLSGGGAWLPNNPLMQSDGARDSSEDALCYMETVIQDVGPASSQARKLAFLDGVADAVLTLQNSGVKWIRSRTYPDYYSHLPGGSVGRSLEVAPFDIRKLGDWFQRSRFVDTMPLPLRSDDFAKLALGLRSRTGLVAAARVGARTLAGLLTRRKLRGMGVALSSSLMQAVRSHDIPVWLNAPLKSLIVEDDEVVGAVIEKDGATRRVRARAGVFIGTGGFGRNAEWRRQHHGIPGWSATPEGDIGTGIQAGIDVGAEVAMMHLVWGTPTIPYPGDDSRGSLLIWERSMPHCVTVDNRGDRFVNEALPYVEFVQAMLDHGTEHSVPCWIVGDHRHTRKYMNLASMLGVEKLKAVGTIVEAQTVAGLAEKIGIAPDRLTSTVERFNHLVRQGRDEDFHRGETPYEHHYGDHRMPNPNLGAIETGPFRAIKVMPGDIGTKGGLLTDEHARVLDTGGKAIAGLYAGGNATASVMGQTYPGPGSTLGPAIVFGVIAARHATARATRFRNEKPSSMEALRGAA